MCNGHVPCHPPQRATVEEDSQTHTRTHTLFKPPCCYSIQVIQYCVTHSKAKCSLQRISEHPVASSDGQEDTNVSYRHMEDCKHTEISSVASILDSAQIPLLGESLRMRLEPKRSGGNLVAHQLYWGQTGIYFLQPWMMNSWHYRGDQIYLNVNTQTVVSFPDCQDHSSLHDVTLELSV